MGTPLKMGIHVAETDSTALGARPLTMIEAFLSFLGLNRREPPPPPPTICRLAGCERKCYEERGRIHDFCRKSHADMHHSALQASNRHNGAGYRRSAPLPRFDATREYVSGDLVLFWQPPSVFSQWTPSPFVVEEVTYACAEQYMMAEKAKLFGDEDMWRQIMATDDPRTHKKLGRKVSGYDQGVWDECKLAIVARGSYAKFTQNELMGQHLLDTGEKILAEASPLDPVWGIGLRADSPAARTPATWRGQNLLGQALQQVRSRMIAEAVGGGAAAAASSL